MKTITLYGLLLLLTGSCFAQYQPFKKYNFADGGYCLLGTTLKSDKNRLQDSLGEFYISDDTLLDLLQKEWVFRKPVSKSASSYHYIAYICRDGLPLEHFLINLNTNEIVFGNQCFYFDASRLRTFYGRLKKPYRQLLNFGSLIEAREYRNKIVHDRSLIMTLTPEWMTYEGTFTFTYPCPEGTSNCKDRRDSILSMLKSQISKQYPGEKFELSGEGNSVTDMAIEVKCNKSLEEKFKLYRRHIEYDKWEPFRLWLTTYWLN